MLSYLIKNTNYSNNTIEYFNTHLVVLKLKYLLYNLFILAELSTHPKIKTSGITANRHRTQRYVNFIGYLLPRFNSAYEIEDENIIYDLKFQTNE